MPYQTRFSIGRVLSGRYRNFSLFFAISWTYRKIVQLSIFYGVQKRTSLLITRLWSWIPFIRLATVRSLASRAEEDGDGRVLPSCRHCNQDASIQDLCPAGTLRMIEAVRTMASITCAPLPASSCRPLLQVVRK